MAANGDVVFGDDAAAQGVPDGGKGGEETVSF